jgi:hypothetical protein
MEGESGRYRSPQRLMVETDSLLFALFPFVEISSASMSSSSSSSSTDGFAHSPAPAVVERLVANAELLAWFKLVPSEGTSPPGELPFALPSLLPFGVPRPVGARREGGAVEARLPISRRFDSDLALWKFSDSS